MASPPPTPRSPEVAGPVMVDCECAGSEPHFVGVALLAGAPTGNICKACGESCEVDAAGLTLPHQHPDLLAMIERGDFDA